MPRYLRCLCIAAVLLNCSASASYPLSDHYNGETFFNPTGTGGKSLFKFLKWYFFSTSTPWPDHMDHLPPTAEVPKIRSDQLAGTFVNHATFLIQIAGHTILTDPIFSERASPSSWVGPKRIRPPGVALEKIPHLDAIVISHNHYDHMDVDSIAYFCEKFAPTIIVPLANRDTIAACGCEKIIELDWWQSTAIGRHLEITATPVQHWSGRYLSDRFKALWAGFYLKTAVHKIYFAGDTGYAMHFKDTADRLGPPDIALLPIGSYEPRWFMKDNHINPEEAVQAFKDLRAKTMIPMHYGTFKLANEGLEQPLQDLRAAASAAGLMPEEIQVLVEGQSLIK